MKKHVILFMSLFLFAYIYATEKKSGNTVATEKFTYNDATIALDAFNENFFNKEMKLYYTTSDKQGRAAIWTQAIYWDMVMNAYKRTGEDKYKDLIEDIYQGGYGQYDGYNWDNTVEWFVYDDLMWWIISLARAYEITKDPKYLGHSILGFERVWKGTPGVKDKGSYDPERGGMKWGWKRDEWRGKMACINYPTVVGAMTLYNITGDKSYLDRAKEIYTWSRNILFDKKDGKVADHKVMDDPVNWTTNLYNQATCIGAAMMLYNETKDKMYLNDAILAADYSKNKMSDKDGILFYKTGIEQGIYTAIFAQYIIRLIEDGNQTQYIDWLRKNIDTAWKNRDKSRNLTFKDAKNPCPTVVIEVYDASGCPALMQVIKTKK
ncbi:MAG: glycoside hydrolase family 76 protein [Dysgonomonas sp.]|nr:glycoside hydrolase family 76 protein [Dysgonomonas sp.]